MIDLHTHILPKMDDGAKNTDMSLAMLNMEYNQGVRTVVLTPHFYRYKENLDIFLERRNASYKHLNEYISKLSVEEQNKLPNLILGAEVAWVPNMSDWTDINKLCIGKTRYMLLELPIEPWKNNMFDQIYDLITSTNIIPVIAHLERYFKIQKSELIHEVLSMDVPIQLSSGAFSSFWSSHKLYKMMKNYDDFIVSSDCHNITSRPPNISLAISAIEKKLGKDILNKLNKNSYNIINNIY